MTYPGLVFANSRVFASGLLSVIYGWSPEIGDPTVFGWTTVVLYFAAALLCWRAQAVSHRSKHIWTYLAVFMLFLGINKQLDLQSLFTAIGRHFAKEQGWYDIRRLIQREFILGLLGLVAAAGAVAVFKFRRHGWTEKMALMGALALGAFIVVRAASFHHFDVFLGQTVQSIRWNVILEIGGILIIAVAAVCGFSIKSHKRKMKKMMAAIKQGE